MVQLQKDLTLVTTYRLLKAHTHKADVGLGSKNPTRGNNYHFTEFIPSYDMKPKSHGYYNFYFFPILIN